MDSGDKYEAGSIRVARTKSQYMQLNVPSTPPPPRKMNPLQSTSQEHKKDNKNSLNAFYLNANPNQKTTELNECRYKRNRIQIRL
jgi:hypothetical protein